MESNHPIIIGITGTFGSGKGEMANYLIEKGFSHFSFRDFLVEEIKRRGLPVDRDSMRNTANALREEHGGDYIAQVLWDRAFAAGKSAVLESIRAPIEVDYLAKQPNTFLFSVNAPIELRYERIVNRGTSTDSVTLEQFKIQEDAEMNDPDPCKQNLAYCREHTPAEFQFMNVGTLEELHQKIDVALALIATRQNS